MSAWGAAQAIWNCQHNEKHDQGHRGIVAAYGETNWPVEPKMFYMYVDRINEVVQDMKRRGFDDGMAVREAWWTAMWRGILWFLSVCPLDPWKAPLDDRRGIILPSNMWGSRIPVYIA